MQAALNQNHLLPKDNVFSSAEKFAPSEFNVTLHGETFNIKLTGSGYTGEARTTLLCFRRWHFGRSVS